MPLLLDNSLDFTKNNPNFFTPLKLLRSKKRKHLLLTSKTRLKLAKHQAEAKHHPMRLNICYLKNIRILHP